MIMDVRQEIVDEFIRLDANGKTPSEVLRIIFSEHGEISPPIIGDYYTQAFGTYVMDVLPYLSSWWIDETTDISDKKFDAKVKPLIEEAANNG